MKISKSKRYSSYHHSPFLIRYSRQFCLWSMFISIISVLVFDIWLLISWDHWQISFLWIFLIHALACTLFLVQAVACWWLRRAFFFGLLTSLLVLFLGPIGAVGILFTATVFSLSRESATPFDIWYEEILPNTITRPEEKVVENLRIWGREMEDTDKGLIAFSDILISGSVQEKQNVIDIIVKNYHPSFAVMLRGALKDPSNTIRAHAVAAIIRIEEMYQDKAFLLERKTVDFPKDFEHILALANHYDEHGNTGLGDASILTELRRKAELLYRRLHDLRPTDERILWSLGRLLIRDNRNRDALSVFEQIIEISADNIQPHQRIWYWQCLYNLHHFDQLRVQIRKYYVQFLKQSSLSEQLLESIGFWLNSEVQMEIMTE